MHLPARNTILNNLVQTQTSYTKTQVSLVKCNNITTQFSFLPTCSLLLIKTKSLNLHTHPPSSPIHLDNYLHYLTFLSHIVVLPFPLYFLFLAPQLVVPHFSYLTRHNNQVKCSKNNKSVI